MDHNEADEDGHQDDGELEGLFIFQVVIGSHAVQFVDSLGVVAEKNYEEDHLVDDDPQQGIFLSFRITHQFIIVVLSIFMPMDVMHEIDVYGGGGNKKKVV